MLVLGRKANETIEIDGGRIRITVVDLRGDKVRLGIDAPKDVTVHRGEVQAAIERNAAARDPEIKAGDRVLIQDGGAWHFARVTDVRGDELRCVYECGGKTYAATVPRELTRRVNAGEVARG